ncbi:hypothetical protein [Nitrosomonas supralitoralis]|uniref:Uncharacterized protein n=1 Tax=Nitrosomonas supralitoralis TaxID=2116706 RepID=A0A2P7NQU8_9PROT|nr:hypothetical protein [Nitrosomonas supralitoralis]PSJ15809.1 hypothetical protein C7H79_16980 [Nitrosomonas supralitoralis]
MERPFFGVGSRQQIVNELFLTYQRGKNMAQQKTALQELNDKAARERNNPDKRDAAEKSPTGEVFHNSNNDPNAYDENPGDVGPNTIVTSDKNPDNK